MERKPLSLDEAIGLISEIARHGEGADRLRALKEIRLMAAETGSVTLPDPMSDQEVIERLARLMRAAGHTVSQLAYRKAYPHAKRPVNHAAPKVLETDVEIDRSKLPVSLKQLYRMFPEIKRSGVPPGYPRGKGLLVVKKWCQEKAIQMIIDREQHRVDVAAVSEQQEEKGTDAETTDP
jgi:hypothetical protein